MALARVRVWWWAVPALVAGSLIAAIDSRSGWDDTGVTAGLLVIAASPLGALARRRAWLVGLLVGGVTPLVELIGGAGPGPLGALVIALAAAYAGAGLALLARPARPSP